MKSFLIALTVGWSRKVSPLFSYCSYGHKGRKILCKIVSINWKCGLVWRDNCSWRIDRLIPGEYRFQKSLSCPEYDPKERGPTLLQLSAEANIHHIGIVSPILTPEVAASMIVMSPVGYIKENMISARTQTLTRTFVPRSGISTSSLPSLSVFDLELLACQLRGF